MTITTTSREEEKKKKKKKQIRIPFLSQMKRSMVGIVFPAEGWINLCGKEETS
jgi:hypothetical protein